MLFSAPVCAVTLNLQITVLLVEHKGSAVMMSSLWIMSNNHYALKRFLQNAFTNQISNNPNAWMTVAIFMALTTITGCINNALTIRNGKGSSIFKPAFWLQFLMGTTLGFPKLLLISFSVCYAPFTFVIFMAFEYGMILGHQKLFFNAFNGEYLTVKLNFLGI